MALGVQGPQGRKVRWKLGVRDLKDALGAGEVGQTVLAQVNERKLAWELVAGEVGRRLRTDDLAGGGSGEEARRAVEGGTQ